MIHRVAGSEHYSSGLIEIQSDWTLLDLLDANETLDAYALEEQLAYEESKKGAGKRGR